MAWRSSAGTNDDLVNNLIANRMIINSHIADAFRLIDRADYAPRRPYDDAPQSIGYGVTISAPHMHALALKHLAPFIARDSRVLDVGSGSGYLTALFAELVPDGTVYGIEHIPDLVLLARANMVRSEHGKKLLDSGRVNFITGDGRFPLEALTDVENCGVQMFDAIHVGAAAATIHPALLSQLRSPGRIFIPLEPQVEDGDRPEDGQFVWIIDKKGDGTIVKKKLFGVRYVPLTDADSQVEYGQGI